MGFANCKKCGKVFQPAFGNTICEACKKKLEDDFHKVKDYLNDNPRATIKQISRDCEVSALQIEKWINEERLVFSEDSPINITCDNCGTKIFTGKYCAKCKAELGNSLTGITNQHKAKLAAEEARRQALLDEQRKGKMYIKH